MLTCTLTAVHAPVVTMIDAPRNICWLLCSYDLKINVTFLYVPLMSWEVEIRPSALNTSSFFSFSFHPSIVYTECRVMENCSQSYSWQNGGVAYRSPVYHRTGRGVHTSHHTYRQFGASLQTTCKHQLQKGIHCASHCFYSFENTLVVSVPRLSLHGGHWGCCAHNFTPNFLGYF